MTDPGVPQPTRRGTKTVAVALIVVSLMLLQDPLMTGSTDWIEAFRTDALLAMLRLGAAVAGIVTAIGLLSVKHWRFWLYGVWFALMITGTIVAEVRDGGDVWVAAGLGSILPSCGGLCLFLVRQR
jgi:hypothetical protein